MVEADDGRVMGRLAAGRRVMGRSDWPPHLPTALNVSGL